MPPVSLRHGAVPSLALLRFLRAQSAPFKPATAARPPPRSNRISHARHNSTLSVPSSAQLPQLPTQLPPSTPPASFSLLSPSSPPCGIFLCSANFSSPLSRHSGTAWLTQRRAFSTTRPAAFLGLRFWERNKRKSGAGPLQPNDLPPRHPEGYTQDDHGNLGRVMRPINEPRIRCTEFDENGNITLVNSEFRKSELIAKVCHTGQEAGCDC